MYPLTVLLLVTPIVTTLEEKFESVYEDGPAYIPQKKVELWAAQISAKLEAYESRVLDRQRLEESLLVAPFARNGTALVEEMSQRIEAVTTTRAAAAVNIARAAEKLAEAATEESRVPKPGTKFRPSVELDKYKSWAEEDRDKGELHYNHSCRGYAPVHLEPSSQFSARVTREFSSAHVPVEVFDCDNSVLSEINRTEILDVEFRKNYANDATFSWQYFCSAQGFLRHYPAASWGSMAGAARGQEEDEPDLYDCRMRAWYIEATGAPRDILVLLDSTGSMSNVTQLTAYALTRELFTALTDDDYVNVIRFNRKSYSAVPCFENTLVPANHINVAALIGNITEYRPFNYTHLPDVLENAVKLLNASRERVESPRACQQAIVLLTDSVPENYTARMREYDPEGSIRMFVFLLGEGLMEVDYAEHMACECDGYFAQLAVPDDASLQARKILKVLERPSVLHHQAHPSYNKRNEPIWGDLYAHVQDTRYAVKRWQDKEKMEQKKRYMRLRQDKEAFLSPEQLMHDYQINQYKSKLGHYLEEEDPDMRYQLMITVSVPAYDPVRYENVTYALMEELQRNCTREERVARLLGVAGVDLPLDDLRLRLPYHKLGPGGSLFLLDHRGNVILHDDLRPVVDGNILKNGYRTVDLLDVELMDDDQPPRHYSRELVQFRDKIMWTDRNDTFMSIVVPYDGRRRAISERRRYFWRNVGDTGFTAVVSLPVVPSVDTYAASREPEPDRNLTGKLAAETLRALNDTDFVIQPDWLYCRYIEQRFDSREEELLHFLRRISEESDFSLQQLHYSIRHLPPGLLDTPYVCDKELLIRLAWEARQTAWFAASVEEVRAGEAAVGQGECALGSSTVFVATVGGLTRWRQRVVAGDGPTAILLDLANGHARASTEPWYRRAVAAGPGTLVLHAPVATRAPPGWVTAARALRHLGVTGFHFRADHLDGLLAGVTAPLCESGTDCDQLNCASNDWNCVLIDDAGWVLAGSEPHHTGHVSHLASAYPNVLRQLLDAKVLQKRWLYDYQGTCFAPQDYGIEAAASRIWTMSVLTWTWLADTIRCVILHVRHSLEVLTLLSLTRGGDATTKVEEQKRKVRVGKDLNRVKWENLYDHRVLINKTLLATCDRRRAIYSLRADAAAQLVRQSVSCSNWSMIAARVPRTNMMLLALYMLCPQNSDDNVDDPRDNLEVEPPLLEGEAMEVRLACWRHQKSAKLLTRGPEATCRAHSREMEQEFRLCEPKHPDKESRASVLYYHLKTLFLPSFLIYCKICYRINYFV